jgi:hypothetical protein
MNSITVETMAYWHSLKGLSREVKLRLIELLTNSVNEQAHETEETADERTSRVIKTFCGAWHGDETAEDIINNINRGKCSKTEPVSFE